MMALNVGDDLPVWPHTSGGYCKLGQAASDKPSRSEAIRQLIEFCIGGQSQEAKLSCQIDSYTFPIAILDGTAFSDCDDPQTFGHASARGTSE